MAINKETTCSITGRFVGGGLFEPRETEEGKEAAYSACVVLDDGQEAKIKKIVAAAIKEKFGNKKPSGLQDWGVRVGDDEEFEESFEKNFINPKARLKKPPRTLIKRNGEVEDVTAEDGIIYAGCYVAASVSAYAYAGDPKKKIKPGVTLNLRWVMFRKDGEPMGDRITDDEFDEYDDAEDAVDDDLF